MGGGKGVIEKLRLLRAGLARAPRANSASASSDESSVGIGTFARFTDEDSTGWPPIPGLIYGIPDARGELVLEGVNSVDEGTLVEV